MPTRAIKDHNDPVARVAGSYFVQKHLHAITVHIGKDQGIQNAIRNRNRGIGVRILLRNHRQTKRPDRLRTPAPPWIGNPTEPGLILKHHADWTLAWPTLV
jgi:hypothetical protein